MIEVKVDLKCPKCKKTIAKIGDNGFCYRIFLYCKRCKEEYEITYKRAKEPINKQVLFAILKKGE